ncbi:hypothetical protein YC2023_061999 [Brassica napus]
MLKFLTEERSVSNAYNVSEIGLNPPMIEVGKFIARCYMELIQGKDTCSEVERKENYVN